MWKSGAKRIDEGPEQVILGSDEAGYGCMAGPLIVGAVAVHRDWYDPEVTDSKDMTQKQRDTIVERYSDMAYMAYQPAASRVLCFLQVFTAKDTDRLNVYTAQQMGHAAAIHFILDKVKEIGAWHGERICVVMDGNLPLDRVRSVPLDARGVGHLQGLVKADLKVPAVSLASVFAKTAQVRKMEEFDKVYPEYGFASHHGYDTPEHREALNRLGPCPIHRQNYRPVRDAVEARDRDAQPKAAWEMFDDD